MTDYEKVMIILKQERDIEMECAKTVDRMMRKTLNPYKRVRYLISRKRFQDHCAGIDLAISRIKRENES